MSIENTAIDSYIRTYTGRKFWPLEPQAEDVAIVDIAHALALKCRYNGHTSRFYSVAEHCVRLSRAASPANKLVALLHDAAEAYLPDVPRPIKSHLTNFREIEARIDKAVAKRFGTVHPFPEEIHILDYSILNDEMKAMLDYGDGPYGEALNIPSNEFGWGAILAKHTFLDEFLQLSGDQHV